MPTAAPNVTTFLRWIILKWEVAAMYNDFYGLTFNPFSKGISEKDSFQSYDFQEMTHRLDYLVYAQQTLKFS